MSDPLGELERIRWTRQALEVLAPGSFLLAAATPAALTHPALEDVVRHIDAGSLLLALQTGPPGRRQGEMQVALAAARRRGVRVAATGQIPAAAGFDAVVTNRRSAGASFDRQGVPLIVIDVDGDDDVDWAQAHQADLVAGAAVGDPIKVAPVDVTRLQR